MTTVLVGVGVAALAFASGVAGLFLQKLLPEPHSVDRSRDMIGAIVGLVSLLLALVLGTLVGSSYAFYCNPEIGTGNVRRPFGSARPRAGRIRARDGSGAREDESHAARRPRNDMGRKRIQEPGGFFDCGAAPALAAVGRICRLSRSEDAGSAAIRGRRRRRRGRDRANPPAHLAPAGQSDLLAAGDHCRIVGADPFCGFGFLSRINATTLAALALGAFAVGSALFLILELSQPFTGVFRVPSGAYDQMLASLGR